MKRLSLIIMFFLVSPSAFSRLNNLNDFFIDNKIFSFSDSFYAQFDNSEVPKLIKNKVYNIKKWEKRADKGDIPAIIILENFYINNHNYQRAEKFALLRYFYSKNKGSALSSLSSIYNALGDFDKEVAFVYLQGEIDKHMKDTLYYKSKTSAFENELLDKNSQIFLKAAREKLNIKEAVEFDYSIMFKNKIDF
ncbi:hypothetical protein IT774_02740 [Salinimonas marina]|uniref:Uncharacterized protein n=1 Tax=Salinimonas marina TaxID=2785918 RepID=A0A7S9HDH4_9ALTE|nr:hypothetical protein [Salinimonas marina]QPG06154.1 hypothetical protein IT774_02740 [Salinimonas marina]